MFFQDNSCETITVQTPESVLNVLHLLYHSDTRLLLKRKKDVVFVIFVLQMMDNEMWAS